MKEIVVISGKGGTGKTSMVAAFAGLAGNAVCADCDVDAANLHLVSSPVMRETRKFFGGSKASVSKDLCTACGRCLEVCRFGAVIKGMEYYSIDPVSCEGCGVCAEFCPAGAVTTEPEQNGDWFISDTANGPLVHARLFPGNENSGKLVTEVRKAARREAERAGAGIIIVDGSPGTGCPVIASLTGADAVLVVAEPSRSAIHDMLRVIQLAEFFGLKTVIMVNRYDINEALTDRIADIAEERSIPFAGRVRFDEDFTKAQMYGKSITDFKGAAAEDVRLVWRSVSEILELETDDHAGSKALNWRYDERSEG